MPFFSDSSGGNDFSARSAGCGPNVKSPFGGRNAPGGGSNPFGGRFVIAGWNGNRSAPGSGTGGVGKAAGLPVGKKIGLYKFELKCNNSVVAPLSDSAT